MATSNNLPAKNAIRRVVTSTHKNRKGVRPILARSTQSASTQVTTTSHNVCCDSSRTLQALGYIYRMNMLIRRSQHVGGQGGRGNGGGRKPVGETRGLGVFLDLFELQTQPTTYNVCHGLLYLGLTPALLLMGYWTSPSIWGKKYKEKDDSGDDGGDSQWKGKAKRNAFLKQVQAYVFRLKNGGKLGLVMMSTCCVVVVTFIILAFQLGSFGVVEHAIRNPHHSQQQYEIHIQRLGVPNVRDSAAAAAGSSDSLAQNLPVPDFHQPPPLGYKATKLDTSDLSQNQPQQQQPSFDNKAIDVPNPSISENQGKALLSRRFLYINVGAGNGAEVKRMVETGDILNMMRPEDNIVNVTTDGSTTAHNVTTKLFRIIILERMASRARGLNDLVKALTPKLILPPRFYRQASIGYFAGERYKKYYPSDPLSQENALGNQRVPMDCERLKVSGWSMCAPFSVKQSADSFNLFDIDSILQTETTADADIVYVSANISTWEAEEWILSIQQSSTVQTRLKYMDLRVYDWQRYRDDYHRLVDMLHSLEQEWKSEIMKNKTHPQVALSRDGYAVDSIPQNRTAQTWESKHSPFLYSILAGNSTLERRVKFQAATWMRDAENQVIVTTNIPRSKDAFHQIFGNNPSHPVHVISPAFPHLEPRLSKMQSWSHLVRLRDAWDSVMKHNESIRFLVLADDDTFVFRQAIEQITEKWRTDVPQWGGLMELPRIDNGDEGKFAYKLRDWYFEAAKSWCALRFEYRNVTEQLYLKLNYKAMRNMIASNEWNSTWPIPAGEDENPPVMRVSGIPQVNDTLPLCSDVFCKKGCPAIAQGGNIIMNRKLVEMIRPHVEMCEADTNMLCERCGSQRLYLCLLNLGKIERSILFNIRRSPFRREPVFDPKLLIASMHGFEMDKGAWTKGIDKDFDALWSLNLRAQKRAVFRNIAPLVFGDELADYMGCGDTAKCINGSQPRNFTCVARQRDINPYWIQISEALSQ